MKGNLKGPLSISARCRSFAAALTLSDEPFEFGAGDLATFADPHEFEVSCAPQFTDGGVGNTEEFGGFGCVQEELGAQVGFPTFRSNGRKDLLPGPIGLR